MESIFFGIAVLGTGAALGMAAFRLARAREQLALLRGQRSRDSVRTQQD